MATYGFTMNIDGNSIETVKKIEAELAKMGITASVQTQKVENAFSGMAAKVGSTLKSLKGIIVGSLAAGGIFGGLEFIKSSKEAFEAVEESTTKAKTALESTKGVAGQTMDRLLKGAKTLSGQTLFGKGAIVDAQSMLLTFTQIRGEIFDKTMPAVLNFATRFKMELPEAANLLGKALNDPLKGMTRLQRQGVVFNATQRETIEKLMKAGKVAQAQKIILKELETEFGGLAQAMAKTDAGKVAMAKKQWGSLKMEIGELVAKLQVELIPTFNKVVSSIKSGFESGPIQFFLHHIKDLFDILLKILPVWTIYKTTLMAIHTTTKLVTQAKMLYRAATIAVRSAIVSETVATEAGVVANNAFKISLLETGVGAFAIALGYVIEKFSSWNKKIEDTVEGLTHIKSLTDNYKNTGDAYGKTVMAVRNSAGMSKEQKAELLSDVVNQKSNISNDLAKTLIPQRNDIQEKLSLLKTIPDFNKTMDMEGHMAAKKRVATELGINTEDVPRIQVELTNALKELNKEIGSNQNKLFNLGTAESSLKKLGVKMPSYTSATSGFKDNAKNTSDLAGAKGGLGEAKVINIKIDTMQKIITSDNSKLKEKGQDAVEVMLRTVNNIAYSQSSTQ